MAVKAILWDLGDVIVPIPYSWPEIVEGVINGMQGDGARVREWFEREGGAELLNDVEYGLFGRERFWKEVFFHGLVEKPDIIMAISLFSWYIRPSDEVAFVLKKLQERYPLIVVSDGDFGSKFVVQILQVHYRISFEKVFISSEFGLKKPALFAPVTDWLRKVCNIEPQECVFIDNKEGNVVVARSIGMTAFVYNITEGTPVRVLLAGLRNAGVEI